MSGFQIKDSGERKVYESGARRDSQGGKGRYDLLPPLALKRLAQHYENGAKKYDPHNWEKGMDVSRMFSSGIGHAFQALAGERDEDHLIAAIWNLIAIVEYEERVRLGILPPELFDGLSSLYYYNAATSGAPHPAVKLVSMETPMEVVEAPPRMMATGATYEFVPAKVENEK